MIHYFPTNWLILKQKKLVENTLGELSKHLCGFGDEHKLIHVKQNSWDRKNVNVWKKDIKWHIGKKETPTGLILNDSEDISIIINGDDHIRLQTMSSGIKLYDLLDKANKIDDYIEEHFNYAFNDKYGYLTTYPTNIGTGMRASILLHLPASNKNKDFQSLSQMPEDSAYP